MKRIEIQKPISRIGPRKENQDNYLTIDQQGHAQYLQHEVLTKTHLKNWPEGHIRLAILDGMGGHLYGRTFVDDAVQQILSLPFHNNANSLYNSITSLHESLFDRYYEGSRSPGSTLIVADITPDAEVVIINIGDSRAFVHLPENDSNPSLISITHDHTIDEMAWRDGFITDQEYNRLKLASKGDLAQALGYGNSKLTLLDEDEFPDPSEKAYRIHSRKLDIAITDTLQFSQPPNHTNDSTSPQPHYDCFKMDLSFVSGFFLATDGYWQKLTTQDEDITDNATLCGVSITD